jgi:hypothetical protein
MTLRLPNYVELISKYDPQRGSIDHTTPPRLDQNHSISIQTIPSSRSRAPWAPWPPAWGSWSSSYGAPNVLKFLPTWSRRWEESNLPTYRGGNDREKADDEKAARVAFNGGRDGVRRHSSSKDSSGSGGVGGGSSSKQWIGTGSFGEVDQRRWLARRWRLGVGSNPHGVGIYL